jgi:hypothetical protein
MVRPKGLPQEIANSTIPGFSRKSKKRIKKYVSAEEVEERKRKLSLSLFQEHARDLDKSKTLNLLKGK